MGLAKIQDGGALTVGRILRVTTWCKAFDQIAQPSFTVRVINMSGPDIVTDGDLALAFGSNINPEMQDIMHSEATVLGTSAQVVNQTPMNIPGLAQETPPLAGGGDGMPSQVCGITSYNTNLAGRKYRGRTYWPFARELGNDPATGMPTNGFKTNLNDILTAIHNASTFTVNTTTVIVDQVVFHRPTLTYDTVTQSRPRQKWATQRRRGNYGQPNSYSPF